MPRPNILYMHSHDSGRYVQPYGHAIPTPNIQRLAQEGVLFRQAFCAGPTCSPSRAALLTGMAPHNAGMIGLAHRGFSLHDYEQHLANVLKQAGYHTALAGVQHVADRPEAIGYDEVLTRERPTVANVAPAASQWLAQAPSEPWFMSVGFLETHREYPDPTASEDIRYTLPPPIVPDAPETRYDMAAYKASARIYDQGVGAVLTALQASGQAGNTLVINTTDHGIAFPGIKCNLTDHGIGVMLIMRGPGGFEGGRVIDAMVSHIDIVPTICALADIQPPDWLQGNSMLPLLHGEVSSIRDEVHAEVTYHAAYEPMRCVRTRRWKYIRRYDGRETPVLPNCDDSPSKSVWLEHGWADRAVDAEQLYDLVYDPQETHNLAMFSTHNDVLDDMRSRLERWMQATDDPLLHGPVPAPRGAKVNDPDGTSPREDCIVIA